MIDNKDCYAGEMKNFRTASTKYLFKGEHWLESLGIQKILIHKEYRHFFKKLSYVISKMMNWIIWK